MRTLMSAPPTQRVTRSPSHFFHTYAHPFEIAPFHISRILPGETLTNLYFESRSVWRGLVSPLNGCRQQFFFFYVRATDLALDDFRNMFVDPTNTDLITSTTLEDATGNVPTYCAPGGIDWTQRCLEIVTAHYFRDEGEAWNSVVTTRGLPVAKIRQPTWMDTLTAAAAMPEGAAIAGATDAGDLDRLMDAFNQLRAMGLVNLDYFDWLRSQGISIPGEDENMPKLVAMFSDWYYPVNTVDPVTGSPTSAFSMVFKESFKKPQFFKEPGFIIGVSVTRPKVFFSNLSGSLLGFASRAWDWMPNYVRDMPETSLKHFADTAALGPLGALATDTGGYFVDMRDDLVHGDQFTMTSAPTNTDTPDLAVVVALPTAALVHEYAPLIDIDGDDGGFQSTFATKCVAHNGVVSLSVKGFEVDYTAGTTVQAV